MFSRFKSSFTVKRYLRTVFVDGMICFVSKFEDGITLTSVSREGKFENVVNLQCKEFYSNGEQLYFVKNNTIYCYSNKEVTSLLRLPPDYTDYKIRLKYGDDKFVLVCKMANQSTVIDISAKTRQYKDHFKHIATINDRIKFDLYSESNRFFVENDVLYITIVDDTCEITFRTDSDDVTWVGKTSEVDFGDGLVDMFNIRTKVNNNQKYRVDIADGKVLIFTDGYKTKDIKLVKGIDMEVSPDQVLEVPYCANEQAIVVTSKREIDGTNITDNYLVNLVVII